MIHWKKRMADLSRGGGVRHPPLVAPLLRSVASQIEAITPQEMLTDPARLTRGISELRRAGGLDVLVTATPSFMEAEAFGAIIDRDVWPAKWKGPAKNDYAAVDDYETLWPASTTLEVAVEATRRLASGSSDDIVIVAALTGPATLLKQLHGNDEQPSDVESDFVARGLAALVRRYGQAGAGVIILVETTDPCPGWHDFFPTITNTAKFLKMPVVLVFDGPPPPTLLPSQILPSFAPGMSPPDGKPFSLTLPRQPEGWSTTGQIGGDLRIVTTAGEVAAEIPMEILLDDLRNIKEHFTVMSLEI